MKNRKANLSAEWQLYHLQYCCDIWRHLLAPGPCSFFSDLVQMLQLSMNISSSPRNPLSFRELICSFSLFCSCYRLISTPLDLLLGFLISNCSFFYSHFMSLLLYLSLFLLSAPSQAIRKLTFMNGALKAKFFVLQVRSHVKQWNYGNFVCDFCFRDSDASCSDVLSKFRCPF